MLVLTQELDGQAKALEIARSHQVAIPTTNMFGNGEEQSTLDHQKLPQTVSITDLLEASSEKPVVESVSATAVGSKLRTSLADDLKRIREQTKTQADVVVEDESFSATSAVALPRSIPEEDMEATTERAAKQLPIDDPADDEEDMFACDDSSIDPAMVTSGISESQKPLKNALVSVEAEVSRLAESLAKLDLPAREIQLRCDEKRIHLLQVRMFDTDAPQPFLTAT